MSQQMLSQPVAGCETFGRSWCSRWGLDNVEDVFFKVFCPLFPLALSRAREPPKHFLSSLTALHQSIPDSIFSILMLVSFSARSRWLYPILAFFVLCAAAAAAAGALPLRIVHLQILLESSHIHLPVNFWTCRGSRMSGAKMLKYMQTHLHPE